jgi:hypothetical protein
MSLITGKLESILNSEAESGSVVIALCGYGGQVPRDILGAALVARATTLEVDASTDGLFSVLLPGNDQIVPAGTYYTVTVKDSNGDVVQVNAYAFQAAVNYDLDTAQPFDPALPLMPLPPFIANELLVVPASDTMIFSGQVFTTFKTTLHGDVLHATFPEMIPGNLYTFIILQDATGGWLFNWGATVHNGTMINLAANSQTTQTFVSDVDGQLYAISAGVYS